MYKPFAGDINSMQDIRLYLDDVQQFIDTLLNQLGMTKNERIR